MSDHSDAAQPEERARVEQDAREALEAVEDLPPVGVEPRLRDPTADYDRLGRKQPRRYSILRLAFAIPAFPERTRAVPAHAVVEETEGEALIHCPCGARPVAVPDAWTACTGCERWYAFIAGKALVFYGSMDVPGHSA